MKILISSLFTVRAGKSKKGFLQQIDALYKDENIHGFGIVLDDVDRKRGGYGYGYYEEDK